jgi:Fe-S-cluster containining protein
MAVPLFAPDLESLASEVNLSKMRRYLKVVFHAGKPPPRGMRFFLDVGEADRPNGEWGPCPFLDEETSLCSIHRGRFIACRLYPLGHRRGYSCPHWNGKPDREMLAAHADWRAEEKKIKTMGSDHYYRKWLQLLYPRGYIPRSSIRREVRWTNLVVMK